MSIGDYMAIDSKDGYVKSYKINRIISSNVMEIPIFVVTLTDNENGTNENGTDNPEEFIIFRNNFSESVNKSGTFYWAVSYSNVLQAIIATVKEAFIHREKVIIEYFVTLPHDFSRANIPVWRADKNLIRSIQIYK